MYNYDQDFIDVSKKLRFSDDEIAELYPHIDEILNHEKWLNIKEYRHHLDTRAIHCLQVCCTSWRKAKKNKNCDAKSVAIGALLHDFFLYDWQNEKVDYNSIDVKRKAFAPKLHGFVHPLIAYNNAEKYFPQLMNGKIKDIIVKHMWPLTMRPPKYTESWIVCFADKNCSLNVFKSPKELPKYIGLKTKKNK